MPTPFSVVRELHAGSTEEPTEVEESPNGRYIRVGLLLALRSERPGTGQNVIRLTGQRSALQMRWWKCGFNLSIQYNSRYSRTLASLAYTKV